VAKDPRHGKKYPWQILSLTQERRLSEFVPCQMLGSEQILEAFVYGVIHQLREEILDTPLLSLISWAGP